MKAVFLTGITATILMGMLVAPAATNSAYGIHTFGGNYVVDIIPGAAQPDSLYHFYAPTIAVPRGTEVSWFNGDPGQPHTVTSGNPNVEGAGMDFNSGIMSYQYFFHYEFDEAGDYPYFCIIHPWRFGLVHVSDHMETGNHFEFSSGAGEEWDLSTFDRNLLKFEPLTVIPDEGVPATYYVTMFARGTNQVLFQGFFPSGQNLAVELISSDDPDQQTTIYGPDRASTPRTTRGAFHVLGNFIEPDTTYAINVVLVSVDGKIADPLVGEQFEFTVR
jgi:plastocyanin